VTMTLRVRRLGLLLGMVFLIVMGTRFVSSAGPVPGDPNYVPTLADAADTTVGELRALPEDAIQIDCAPGMPTAPPFTRLAGHNVAKEQMWILADGRCFVYSNPNVSSPEPIVPTSVTGSD
jgi:hypothetical protein